MNSLTAEIFAWNQFRERLLHRICSVYDFFRVIKVQRWTRRLQCCSRQIKTNDENFRLKFNTSTGWVYYLQNYTRNLIKTISRMLWRLWRYVLMTLYVRACEVWQLYWSVASNILPVCGCVCGIFQKQTIMMYSSSNWNVIATQACCIDRFRCYMNGHSLK